MLQFNVRYPVNQYFMFLFFSVPWNNFGRYGRKRQTFDGIFHLSVRSHDDNYNMGYLYGPCGCVFSDWRPSTYSSHVFTNPEFSKGQLISDCPFRNFKFSKNPPKNLIDFCPGRFYTLVSCDLFWLF